jgi:hypothetical protein
VYACAVAAAFLAALGACVRVLAGALCCGGTSMSVRMLREMAAEEVGLALCVCLLYLGGRVVAVGTEGLQCAFEWVCVSVCAVCG